MKARKVALSASADPVPSFEKFTDLDAREIANRINAFDLITVRDPATLDMLFEIGVTNSNIEMLPDPTFFTSIDEVIRPYPHQSFSGKPVLGIQLPLNMEERVIKLAHELGYEVWNWNDISGTTADHRIPSYASVGEVLGAFKNVQCFVTDRFHSSIFTMKIAGVAPIFIEDSDKWSKKNSKGRHLYSISGIENRVLVNSDPNWISKLETMLLNGMMQKSLPSAPENLTRLLKDVLNK